MEAQLYSKGKEHLLRGDIDLLSGRVLALLVDSTYTVDLANHESRVSIPETAIVAEEVLENTSVNNGVFDADDVIFMDVSGLPVYTIVLLYDAEVFSQSWLIAAYTSTTPIVTPDESAITLQWDVGTNKIFAI